jgi:hypothetical protein
MSSRPGGYLTHSNISQSRDLLIFAEVPALAALNLYQTLGSPAGMTTSLIDYLIYHQIAVYLNAPSFFTKSP